MPMFAIYADGELDQVVETRKLAEKEARDLRLMGFRVSVREVQNEDDAEKGERG